MTKFRKAFFLKDFIFGDMAYTLKTAYIPDAIISQTLRTVIMDAL